MTWKLPFESIINNLTKKLMSFVIYRLKLLSLILKCGREKCCDVVFPQRSHDSFLQILTLMMLIFIQNILICPASF